jgi:hypothetical protein
MKHLWLLLATMLALLTACPSESVNTPGAFTLSGQLSNYTQGSKPIVGIGFGEPLFVTVGQGTLQADGRFSLTLPSNPTPLQAFSGSCAGATISPSDAKGMFLFGLAAFENSQATLGLYYATGTDSTAAGYKRQMYFYADKNTTINGTCDDTTFNLSLKAGWNKVSTSFAYSQGVLTGTTYSSAAMPAGAQWLSGAAVMK